MLTQRKSFTGQIVPSVAMIYQCRHGSHGPAWLLSYAAKRRACNDRFGQHLALAQYVKLAR